jgi:hypothetical protein
VQVTIRKEGSFREEHAEQSSTLYPLQQIILMRENEHRVVGGTQVPGLQKGLNDQKETLNKWYKYSL